MSETVVKHALTTAGLMVVFFVMGTLILAITYTQTQAPIAASVAHEKQIKLSEVIPSSVYDNDLMANPIKISFGGLLGNRQDTTAYLATKQGEPVAIALEATAPDGYSGEIKLLVAVTKTGEILGTRVIVHKETPGLGDYIDIAHSDWIKQFDQQSLATRDDTAWKVKKDGGQFDYMAGATITPRAVVKAIHRVLQYVQSSQATLFQVKAATP